MTTTQYLVFGLVACTLLGCSSEAGVPGHPQASSGIGFAAPTPRAASAALLSETECATRLLAGWSCDAKAAQPHSGLPAVATQYALAGTEPMQVIYRSNSYKKFGTSVALDGDRAVIGHSHDSFSGEAYSGAAHVYERQEHGSWAQVARLAPADPQNSAYFAGPVAISGNVILASTSGLDAPDPNSPITIYEAGAAYVFERDGSTGSWRQTAKLTRPYGDQRKAWFGSALAIANGLLFVGASGDDHGTTAGPQYGGAVYVYGRGPTGAWELQDEFRAGGSDTETRFGTSLSAQHNILAVGATGAENKVGVVYIFERDPLSDAWEQTAQIRAPVPQRLRGSLFGRDIALSPNARYITIGASTGDWGYIFERAAGQGSPWDVSGSFRDWYADSPLDYAQLVRFGGAVAMDNEFAFFSALNSDIEANDAGTVFVAQLKDDGTWQLSHALTRLLAPSGEQMAFDLATNGDALFIAAPASTIACQDDSSAGLYCHTFAQPGAVFVSEVTHRERIHRTHPHPTAETITLRTPRQLRIVAEVGRTATERGMGLAYRDRLAQDRGFLMVYSDSQPRSFCMTNTYIPLDIVLLDETLKVAEVVAAAQPLTGCQYQTTAAARYALQIAAGTAADHGLEPGAQVAVEIDHRYDLSRMAPSSIAYEVRDWLADPERGKIRFSRDGEPLTELEVAVARTAKQREWGFRHRSDMGDLDGMLFVFENASSRSMVMGNVEFPLDFVYVGADLDVNTVYEHAVPGGWIPTQWGKHRFVVALRAGAVSEFGIGQGVTMAFRPLDQHVAYDTNPSCGGASLGAEGGSAPSREYGLLWSDRQIPVYTAGFDADSDPGSTETGFEESIAIYFMAPLGGPYTAPGTYALGGFLPTDCVICVYGYTDCTSTGCGGLWYASEGYVQITQISNTEGGPLSGELFDVVLRQLDSDSTNRTTTPMADRNAWCIDRYLFDVSLMDCDG